MNEVDPAFDTAACVSEDIVFVGPSLVHNFSDLSLMSKLILFQRMKEAGSYDNLHFFCVKAGIANHANQISSRTPESPENHSTTHSKW